MHKRLGLFLLVLLILLSSVFIFTGCSGYTRFTLREGDAHFTFEYPKDYDEKYVSIVSIFTRMTFCRSLLEEDWIDSWFRVRVSKVGWWSSYPDAKATLEADILWSADTFEDYQILERSPVSVAGVEGEQVISSYTAEHDDPHADYFMKEGLTVNRDIYFDHNGFIWEITMMSIEEMAEADEAVWEHILKTFKILD